MYEVERLLRTSNELGEGPLWNPVEKKLYWIDIPVGHTHRITPGASSYETFVIDQMVGCLALRAKGGFLTALQHGIYLWNPDTNSLEQLIDPEADKPHSRFNGGKVDRAGRFWAGTTGDNGNSALYRYDADGSIHVMQTGVTCSNGLGWSPDNRTMYYNDSQVGTMWVYDFDFASGDIANRRVFYKSDKGEPDGLTVDREGCIWTAVWGGWCVLRFDPDGKIMTRIEMPVERPTCPIFGGENLDELYVTSAIADLTPQKRLAQPHAGDLFRISAGVKGFPEPLFAG